MSKAVRLVRLLSGSYVPNPKGGVILSDPASFPILPCEITEAACLQKKPLLVQRVQRLLRTSYYLSTFQNS